jgi:hypothetical protein
VHHVDPAADQAIAKAQRIAMDLDEPDVGQQIGNLGRIEMLAPGQPVGRVNPLPILEEAARPGVK